MSHFTNKVYIVTGATSGIGHAIALDLAPKGGLLLEYIIIEVLKMYKMKSRQSKNTLPSRFLYAGI